MRRLDTNFDIGDATLHLVAATHKGEQQKALVKLSVKVSRANNRAASDSGSGISIHIQSWELLTCISQVKVGVVRQE